MRRLAALLTLACLLLGQETRAVAAVVSALGTSAASPAAPGAYVGGGETQGVAVSGLLEGPSGLPLDNLSGTLPNAPALPSASLPTEPAPASAPTLPSSLITAGQVTSDQLAPPRAERSVSRDPGGAAAYDVTVGKELARGLDAAFPDDSTQNRSVDAAPADAPQKVSSELSQVGELAANGQLDPLFDGKGRQAHAPEEGSQAPATAESPAQQGRPLWRTLGAVPLLGRLVPSSWAGREASPPTKPPVKSPLDSDDNGGPPRKELSFLGRITYGARWAVNLLAIGAFFEYAIQPLIARIPWTLWLPEAWLNRTGRVELMISRGPDAISAAFNEAPWSFLFWELPRMSAMEEILFRLVSFSLILFPLMALRSALPWAVDKLEKIPNIYRIRGFGQTLLRGLHLITKKAFWVAALVSTYAFVTAHFPAWGIHPYTILLHGTLGLALTYIAYRSRSLVPSTVAHFLYNLGGILLSVGLPLLLGADLAGTIKVLIAVALGVGLYFNWRTYRQDRRAILKGMDPASGPTSSGRKAPRALLEAAVLILAISFPGFAPLLFRGPTPEMPPMPETAVVAPQVPWPARPARAKIPQEQMIQEATRATVLVSLPKGSGTGFIVDKNGLVITNAHVVAQAGKNGRVQIIFANGQRVWGEVMSINRYKDIAVVRLPRPVGQDGRPSEWPVIRYGDPAYIRPGDTVYALGHPMGNPFSLSRGIISNVQRKDNFVFLFQTDTAINPGNSGGPLLNEWGEVVAMNTKIMSASGGSQGLGFAIRSDEILAALNQYHALGSISPSYMGIIADLRDSQTGAHGLRIDAVRPGSPADAAGLQAGDVLLAINDRPIGGGPAAGVAQVRKVLAGLIPGSKATVQIRREGEEQTLEMGVPLVLGDEADKPEPAIVRFYGALPPMISRFLPPLNPAPGPQNPH